MNWQRPVMCALALAAGYAVAAPETVPPPGEAAPGPKDKGCEKIGPHLYRAGKVVIDAQQRAVRCPGKINMAEGDMIELVACLPTGKLYESLLVLDIAPMDLQLALLLLDMDAGRNPAVKYREDDPDRLKDPGDTATVSIEWREPPEGDAAEGKLRRERVEWFLRDVDTKEPLEPAEFVFLGSRMVEGRLGAGIDGTLVTLFHDPYAIMEMGQPRVMTAPWSGVDEKRCPPVGTPVTLIIHASARGDDGADAKEEAEPEE